MLASWSTFETTSSSPGLKSRAMERLRKSWVVEGPSVTYGVGEKEVSCGDWWAIAEGDEEETPRLEWR